MEYGFNSGDPARTPEVGDFSQCCIAGFHVHFRIGLFCPGYAKTGYRVLAQIQLDAARGRPGRDDYTGYGRPFRGLEPGRNTELRGGCRTGFHITRDDRFKQVLRIWGRLLHRNYVQTVEGLLGQDISPREVIRASRFVAVPRKERSAEFRPLIEEGSEYLKLPRCSRPRTVALFRERTRHQFTNI